MPCWSSASAARPYQTAARVSGPSRSGRSSCRRRRGRSPRLSGRQGGVPFQYGQLPLEPPLVRPLQPRNRTPPRPGTRRRPCHSSGASSTAPFSSYWSCLTHILLTGGQGDGDHRSLPLHALQFDTAAALLHHLLYEIQSQSAGAADGEALLPDLAQQLPGNPCPVVLHLKADLCPLRLLDPDPDLAVRPPGPHRRRSPPG